MDAAGTIRTMAERTPKIEPEIESEIEPEIDREREPARRTTTANARAAPPSERTRVRRLPERGVYERDAIDAILDEALICHLAYVQDGEPRVIPTIHARVGDTLYVHGSNASRTLRSTKGGAPVAAEVTLIDGLVLARSAFHHSMNYRSVVVYGRAREVTDPPEKFEAQRALVEHVVRGPLGGGAPAERSRAQSDDDPRDPDRRGIGEGAHRSTEGRGGGPGAARCGPASSRSRRSPASPSPTRSCRPGSIRRRT